MASNGIWTGHLKLWLVTIPVRIFSATQASARVELHQLHKGCNLRVKYQKVCPEHGPLDDSEIVKGYEYEKGHYVLLEEKELDRLKIETTRTLEVTQFADAAELECFWWDTPYYLAPEGEVGEEAYQTVQAAMKQAGKIAIGRVVLSRRERMVVLAPYDRGFLLSTLRTADEIRKPATYFKDVPTGKVQAKQMELVQQLIDSHTEKIDVSHFKDRYREALMHLIEAKRKGVKLPAVKEERAPRAMNFMEALRASLKHAGKAPATTPGAAGRKAGGRSLRLASGNGHTNGHARRTRRSRAAG